MRAAAKVCAGGRPSEEDDGLCESYLEGRIGLLDHGGTGVGAARLRRLMRRWMCVCVCV